MSDDAKVRIVFEFSGTERVVGIVNYRDRILVATERRLYEIVNDFQTDQYHALPISLASQE